ncbi:MAG: EcsC family protein [Candidatus Cloacimonetes bacterium]|nr:EcsC family protein [Candidatus Cloacimonadota bacterium]
MEKNNNSQYSPKKAIIRKVEQVFLSTVRMGLNDKKAAQRVSKTKNQYRSMPNDALATILIKRAARKTMIEGAANGAGITGCELALIAPAPEGSHKVAAVSGIVALFGTDVTFTTSIQMKLIQDLGYLYGVPFDESDEEDVWLIFKAAIGVKGSERVGGYVRVIFYETARKQFRKFLRTGIRRAIQKYVIKKSSEKIGRYLGEKYILRLVPAANMIIGGYFNRRITLSVGKWAKIRSKIRSTTLTKSKLVSKLSPNDRYLILPLIFFSGTSNDKLTDNLLMLYSNTTKQLLLTDNELKLADELTNDEHLEKRLMKILPKVSTREAKDALFDIAVSAAAVNIRQREKYHNCLRLLANSLSQDKYTNSILKSKIAYLKR